MMRTIHIANLKNRDATICFDGTEKKKGIEYKLPNGADKKNVKILKMTSSEDINSLLEKYDDLLNIADELIAGDPEINLEKTGMIIDSTKRLYVTKDYDLLYGVELYEVVKAANGEEKERHHYEKSLANVNSEIPIKCSTKLIAKEKAAKMFVFSRKYQIKHVNGLTFDFLFDIAKELSDKKSLMFVGGGSKGIEPLIFQAGGSPYRCFLEGRVKGESYSLTLHLTNLELKEL